MIKEYPARGVLGLTLMTGQAFLYNALAIALFYSVGTGFAILSPRRCSAP